MHVTKDLELTLRNVRKLLQPGGKLIMCDPMRSDLLSSGFVTGLLAGWWVGTENFREWGPLCSESKWNELLLQNGYSGNDLVIHDFLNKDCHENSIIVTTVDPTISITTPATTIIVDPRFSENRLAAELLQKSLLSMGSEEVDILPLETVLTKSDLKSRLYISLLEYNDPILYELDETTFTLLKSFFLSAKSILWVTGGAVYNPSSPNFGVVEGLFRVLRNEDISVSFVSLALEPSANALERHI
jgi:hypothetical protein